MKPNIMKTVFSLLNLCSAPGGSRLGKSLYQVFSVSPPLPPVLFSLLPSSALFCAPGCWRVQNMSPGTLSTQFLVRFSQWERLAGGKRERLDSSSLLRTLVFSENCVCLSVGVKPINTTKPNMGRSKDLLSATSKENIGDLSQRSIFSNNKTGKALN